MICKYPVKGSRNNNSLFWGVETPVWQGEETQEYQYLPVFAT
jgi:hypothetical protein